MWIELAPLQGITDAAFRRLHAARFPGVNCYMTPFLSPTAGGLTRKEIADVLPENNSGVALVPQVLSARADHFLEVARMLSDLGYSEVNLNLGCPSGTVTAKGKGAGMLSSCSRLELFLDEIFAASPLRISIKTRLGYTAVGEFDRLMEIYRNYPLLRLIVHARTRAQQYSGHPFPEAVLPHLEGSPFPVFYNGDLFDAPACRRFCASFPGFAGIMVGRGLIANPALAREVRGGAPLCLDDLSGFHQELLDEVLTRYDRHAALGRMREIGKYMASCFASPRKPLKAIRKARLLEEYLDAFHSMLDTCSLREHPGFAET